MSNYSKTTNFTAKDALASGDPLKVIKGSEHDAEYDNIATASATKANKTTPATTNNLAMLGAAGDLADSLVETDGAGNITCGVTGALTGNADTATSATTAANLSGSNFTGDVTNVANAMTIPADTVTESQMENALGTHTTTAVGTGGFVIPKGFFNAVRLTNDATIYLELNVAGTWRRNLTGMAESISAWSDGTNMQLITATGTQTIYYQTMG